MSVEHCRSRQRVNCHQTVVVSSLQSAMTALSGIAPLLCARFRVSGFDRALFALSLLTDGYPIKMIKRNHLR
jgi:hypothetical protein